jgi:hypothetical protein
MTQNYSTRRPWAIAFAIFLEQRIIAGIKNCLENAIRIGHAGFISTGLQSGVGLVREPEPFQRLFPRAGKPLKRLTRLAITSHRAKARC